MLSQYATLDHLSPMSVTCSTLYFLFVMAQGWKILCETLVLDQHFLASAWSQPPDSTFFFCSLTHGTTTPPW